MYSNEIMVLANEPIGGAVGLDMNPGIYSTVSFVSTYPCCRNKLLDNDSHYLSVSLSGTFLTFLDCIHLLDLYFVSKKVPFYISFGKKGFNYLGTY